MARQQIIKKNSSVKRLIESLPFFIIVFFVGIFVFVAQQTHRNAKSAATDSFIFGAAGDYGSTSNTDGVLTGIKNGGLNFQLALGDLSYDTKGSPAGWAAYVKGLIGEVPFVIVSGNHDESKMGEFVDALPNPMTGVSGTYGDQYYFDYPASGAYARFIMISPNVLSADPAWISSSIDSARAAGISWIIVGMHKNCITVGQKSCEIGQALLSQLLEKKVDVILQGHDHNYQRSKQLNCATASRFVETCVVNAGSSFTKGAGTVIVIVGTGGNGFYSVSSGDSEAGYFSVINGDTYGYAKFSVTKELLSEQFVRTGGGSLSDSFTIAGSEITAPSTNPSFASTPGQIAPTYACIGSCPIGTPTPGPTVPQVVEPTKGIIVNSTSIFPLQGSTVVSTSQPVDSSCVGRSRNPVRGFVGLLLRLLSLFINFISRFFGGNGNIVSPPIEC